jgi:hypothetical protein
LENEGLNLKLYNPKTDDFRLLCVPGNLVFLRDKGTSRFFVLSFLRYNNSSLNLDRYPTADFKIWFVSKHRTPTISQHPDHGVRFTTISNGGRLELLSQHYSNPDISFFYSSP